jgi:tetratricopeptide (TPR) repeat protein
VLTKKKKITKKEIKEDKLVTIYYKTIEFFNEYKKQIYIYGGTLLVIIIAVYWFVDRRSKNNDKASAELAKVLDFYERGSYQEAIDGNPANNVSGLKKIVDEYGSTDNGEAAKIFIADSYAALGKIEDAYKYYDDYSGNNKTFEATALAGKASYFEFKNEYLKAANTFNEAGHLSKENALNAEYLLKASINYISAGDKEKAKELLKKIKDEYKTSMAIRDADRYLALVEEPE